ncbi:hypothetical protein BFW01_g281 [Lasiodiplodia theobromae]|uniref:Uncharacterized protein n=1 Tax=Lasiodiplodia theobromae TaxID=45133 RepID=A0A8H7IRE1_9PEZI|nr:hypothetical protein BFW01_g281 [Lasiodiplodia theobromae]
MPWPPTSPKAPKLTSSFTFSYGILFLDALIATTSMQQIGIGGYAPVYLVEDLQDNTFTFRDPSQGLNMDFMTYSMYAMAGKDPTALLDASLLQNLTQTTFSIFFRHYVSNNLSMTTGGSAYQPINASLPEGVVPPWNFTTKNFTDPTPLPVSNTGRTAMAEVHTRIELLEINAAAVWLSVVILVWLIATTIVVAVMQRGYLKNLDRDIECVGDVLVLVAGSERLLSLARKRQLGELEDLEQIRTKLGWFEDGSGQQRWGIEVVQRE